MTRADYYNINCNNCSTGKINILHTFHESPIPIITLTQQFTSKFNPKNPTKIIKVSTFEIGMSGADNFRLVLLKFNEIFYLIRGTLKGPFYWQRAHVRLTIVLQMQYTR